MTLTNHAKFNELLGPSRQHQVVLHSDDGSPMKGATMLATLQSLGGMPSFSRPAVSNDNSFSESLFRTMKYRPTNPRRPFENLLADRQWVGAFVQWYNHEHRHSAIGFVTPDQRHTGLDSALLNQRVQVYEAARTRHPQRWTGPSSLLKLDIYLCLSSKRTVFGVGKISEIQNKSFVAHSERSLFFPEAKHIEFQQTARPAPGATRN